MHDRNRSTPSSPRAARLGARPAPGRPCPAAPAGFGLLGLLGVLGALGASLGCVSDKPASDRGRGTTEAGFVQPTASLADEIEAHARAVRAGRSLDVFAREAEWFVGVGEPAYPTLLELAADPDVRVASFGLATISACRDPRLLAPLKAEVAPPSEGALRFEYARALVALGDWSEAPVLLDALASEDVRTRGSALKALRDATGETHGYHPQGAAQERAAAIERWRAWWAARAADPLLTPVGR